MCIRCHSIIPYTDKYCEKCIDIVEKEKEENKRKRNRRYDSSRDKQHVKFYNSVEWIALSKLKMQNEHYQCEKCRDNGVFTIATEVHHKIPIAEDWDKRFDIDNLQCLCKKCHNQEHGRFTSRGGGR